MGKWWQIINVDGRESSQHLWGELGSWFFYPHEHLLSHISMPVLPKDVDEWLADRPVSPQPGPLSHMPVELLDLIFDSLHALHEVIRLSITCKPLLAVGKRHLLRATRAHYAPWAGARLISLDDSTAHLDALPPSLLTDSERKEIERADFPKYGESGDGGGEEVVERSLSNFASHYYRRVFHKEWRQPRINDVSTFERHLRSSALTMTMTCVCPGDSLTVTATERDVHMFRTLYGDGRRPTYPSGVRVLCNLSKGEYVRADGLRVPPHVNLAHALLARICWSSEREVGMVCADDYRPQLTAGTWAGDRFCVTSLDVLPEMGMGMGMGIELGMGVSDAEGDGEKREWKDVTCEVAEVLTHIWEKNSAKWLVFCK